MLNQNGADSLDDVPGEVPLHGRIVEQGGVLHQAQDLAQIGEGTLRREGERVADVAVDDLPALGFQGLRPVGDGAPDGVLGAQQIPVEVALSDHGVARAARR